MYGRRKAILSALNFTVPAGEGGAAAPATGAAAAGVAPDSAAGQALDAQAAAAGQQTTDTKPPGYVPVGELAQERQKRHALEQQLAQANAASAAQLDAARKALGLAEGQTPEQLAAAVEAAKGTANEAVAQLAVFKLAPGAGGDAAALLDSASFLKTLKTIDTTNEEAVKAAVTAAIADNPKLAAQKVAPGGSRDAATGSGSGSTKATMSDLIRAAAGK